MNPAVPSLPATTRRLQAALALLALAGAVVATSVLVATPPAPDAGSHDRMELPVVQALPPGLRVDIRGGDAWTAYRVADVLGARGASVQGVEPALDVDSLEAATSIVYYEREDAASATLVRRILDRGWVRHEQVFHPGADVTIVLGKDEPHA
ncbi:MAG TPA: LytR C-terminal domain-containing protein [Acidimicrobiales bacterium]|nr:LytR C-terminal domain-containing protein [Acidimicrobiales bacterium]